VLPRLSEKLQGSLDDVAATRGHMGRILEQAEKTLNAYTHD
jgi:hypothetical protein